MADFDLAIIGAGIAGASLAAEIAPHARVLLLEAEDTPGYHTTGRSAAFWEECYGGPELVPLSRASGHFLRENGYLSPRGALYLGRGEDAPALDALQSRFADTGAHLERLPSGDVRSIVPHLKPAWSEAIHQPHCADIDVAGLHQHYLSTAKRGGVELVTRARIAQLERVDGTWRLTSEDGRSWSAKAIANAAGAWADHVASLAGARPLGIQPLHRTIMQAEIAPTLPSDGPLVLDIGGRFYFKPESGGVWLSPHDETPVEPGDAAPDELAVAEAIDRFINVLDVKVTRITRKWAGLRSFSPDRLPVYGWDPQIEGFFWFAGQGGYGIQTAPAAARLGAQLFTRSEPDSMTNSLPVALYSPERFD